MIKNIIFDIDGVLTNMDDSCYRFLKTTYPEFKDLSYSDMEKNFPIASDNGSFELPKPYSNSWKNSCFYLDRPLYADSFESLQKLKDEKLRLFGLTTAIDIEVKRAWIEKLFNPYFESTEVSPAGISKTESLKLLLSKFNLIKNETIFIDDRFMNVRDGLASGVHVARMKRGINLPLPQDLSHVKEFNNMKDFVQYILNTNKYS